MAELAGTRRLRKKARLNRPASNSLRDQTCADSEDRQCDRRRLGHGRGSIHRDIVQLGIRILRRSIHIVEREPVQSYGIRQVELLNAVGEPPRGVIVPLKGSRNLIRASKVRRQTRLARESRRGGTDWPVRARKLTSGHNSLLRGHNSTPSTPVAQIQAIR